MTTRIGLISTLALLPAIPALGQTPQDMFTEGSELVDEWMSMRHVIDLDGQPPLDVLGWWWTPGSNNSLVRVRAWTSDGLGGLEQVWEFTTPSSTGSGLPRGASALGDFSGNGVQDFVIGVRTGAHVYLQQGTQLPVYIAHVPDIWDSQDWLNRLGLLAHDIDGNGLDDLITATPKSLRVFRNLGLGLGFQLVGSEVLIAGTPVGLTSHHIEIALGELDGDATAKELAVLRHDVQSGVELRIYALSAGGLSAPTIYPVDVPADAHLVIGDIEGNGLDDIVLFGPAGEYQVLRQTAPGLLSLEPLAPGGPSTHLVDVNGDGLLDGICCSSGGGGSPPNVPNNSPSLFRVALNNGAGGFDHAVTFPGLGSQRIAGAVDMDGDGDLDLLGGRMILFNHLFVGTSYCDANENSSGDAAAMRATGTASIARADLNLIADHVPSHQFGLFYLGQDAVQIPFGDGYRCIGGQTYRLDVLVTDGSGKAEHALDLTSSRGGPGGIEAGSTWRFQFWFRDPAGASGTFNLSDGLRVTFGP